MVTKEEFVQSLFSRIAGKYDFLNDLMTFSLHRRWKKLLIQHAAAGIQINKGAKVLDLCTGTGDIAEQWLEDLRVSEIAAIDSCTPMLAVGYDRIQKKFHGTFPSRLKMQEGNALSLPYPDNYFDAVTVGFGLRNVGDLLKTLQEVYRVLKPGGIVASLDLGHPPAKPVSFVYKKIFLKFIPFIGSIFAADKYAYQYLVDSLNTWPSQKQLSQGFYDLGFSRSYYEDLMLGTVAIVVAQK